MPGFIAKTLGFLLVFIGVILAIIVVAFYGWNNTWQEEKLPLWLIILLVISVICLLVGMLMIAVGCIVEYHRDSKKEAAAAIEAA
jgi:uncharacterized membrane protein